MAHSRRFNDDEMIKQIFPFKAPIIKYIFDNINYKHLHKLYQCSKLFPNKFPLVIIDRFDNSYILKLLKCKEKRISPENVSKIWVSDAVYLSDFQPGLPTWISKIWICTIKEITLMNQDLLLKEFKLVIQNQNIETLDIRNIIDENGYSLSVEEIVAYVSNANKIKLRNASTNPETFTKLASMVRKSKLSIFVLHDVKIEIIIDEVLKFIEAHASSDRSKFCIYFNGRFSADFVKNFQASMKTQIFLQPQFKRFLEKPRFNCGRLGF